MPNASLKTRMLRGDVLTGTFIKTPAHDIIEVLAMSGMDFLALDAEHSPFDRRSMDACLAIGRALDFPILVRVPDGSPAEILKAMDSGATGVVVPHVATVEKAENIAKWSRFGYGGRGYAGSTRWAGFATRPMPEILQQSVDETVVIAQIEEPEGVDLAGEIAATEGIDGLFVGPADLAVCLGLSDPGAQGVLDAMKTVGDACKRNRKAAMTFAGSSAATKKLHDLGIHMFFIGSEHAMMLNGAKQIMADMKSNFS